MSTFSALPEPAQPAETRVRALNAEGLARFAAYVDALRGGSREAPPHALLDDPELTVEPSAAAYVEQKRFATRWGMAEHVADRLAALPPDEVEDNAGLWAWLSLFYFDQVCPAQPSGARKPGALYRHVPDFAYMYRYRHLVYGPFAVYRRHRGHAILVLSGVPNVEGSIYQEITSRQDLLASRGVLEALNVLYLDHARGTSKRGVAAGLAPGTIRRFVRVMQQLDLTYDICGMTGDSLLALLPPEFDGWKTGVPRRRRPQPVPAGG